MTPERWTRLKEIFHAALELPPPDRAAFIAGACGADTALHREIASLLQEHTTSPGLASPVRLPDLTGQIISHYQILEKIGHGGMGVVYRAQDLKLGRPVALKFPVFSALTGEEFRTRFFQEAKTLAALDHPNICPVYEIDEVRGRLFFTMKLLPGPAIREKIASGPLDPAEVIKITAEAARGLRAAHRQGIIHRDLKPANIMLDAGGQAVLTDFGISRRTGSEAPPARPAASPGTPAYLSPEQAGGEKADYRSDIWSLGVVFYEMTAGRLPFPEDDPAELCQAILHREPERLTAIRPGTPPEFDRIAEKMLAKNPERRYQQAGDLLADLEPLLEQPGKREDPSGDPGRAPAKIRLRPLLVTAAAVLLPLILWAIFRQDEPPGLNPTALPAKSGLIRTPAISPDGRWIACSWNGLSAGNFGIYLQEVGSQAWHPLTSHPAAESNPVWSPDGRFVAFYRAGSKPGTF